MTKQHSLAFRLLGFVGGRSTSPSARAHRLRFVSSHGVVADEVTLKATAPERGVQRATP